MSNQTAVKKADKEEEKRKQYAINIRRTLLPVATGFILGIISFGIYIFVSSDFRRAGGLMLVLVIIGIYIHRWTLPLVNANKVGETMAFKDWAYIGFLVFMTWFVSFTLLLNL